MKVYRPIVSQNKKTLFYAPYEMITPLDNFPTRANIFFIGYCSITPKYSQGGINMAFRLRWPTEYGTITQHFGEHPEIYTKFGLPGHEGIDFVAPEGSKIFAAADGTVSDVRLDGSANPLTKPYGNQVRIKHDEGYETVYAHLSQATVTAGQKVKAGDLIGKAGNTGNSLGAHLHMTLKKQGATAGGATPFKCDIVDPTPFLAPFNANPNDPAPKPTLQLKVESPEVGSLNLRNLPSTSGVALAQIPHGATVTALETEADVRRKVGQMNQWLQVRTADGKQGYVAAWYLILPAATTTPPAPTPTTSIELVVNSPEVGYLNIRNAPSTTGTLVTQAVHDSKVLALEPEADIRKKVGVANNWIRLRTSDGYEGYAAANYLRLPSTAPSGAPVKYVLVESPEYGLKVRQNPDANSPQIWWIPHQTVLESLENPAVTGGKLGQDNMWLHVRTPSHREGYVSALYLKAPDGPDNRAAVQDEALPYGTSANIFGMHMAGVNDDSGDGVRAIFQSQGKKGWVFFTESIGKNPVNYQNANPDIRSRLWNWVQQGYGVIVRLNHSYSPDGTLPESAYYEEFAETCARWVEVHLKHDELAPSKYTWFIQIANEMNNPNEQPGGRENRRETITPELYARAFNLVYARIKAVLPNSIIMPGAVDPYNPEIARPIDYFQKMLDNIQAVDGFVLHAYTHGQMVQALTHLNKFGPPLEDHYIDFQTYTLFMERIPGRWKGLPVLITETNHIATDMAHEGETAGWSNSDVGWVQAAYAEIHRWNTTPYYQQILGLFLYRWLGDQWAIHDKPEIQQDFAKAIAHDYRWRKAPAAQPTATATAAAAAGLNAPTVSARPVLLIAPAEAGANVNFAPSSDDLSRLLGISPKTAIRLNLMGIDSFAQLGSLDVKLLKDLIKEAGLRLRYVESWPEQARLAAADNWDELKALQRQLNPKKK